MPRDKGDAGLLLDMRNAAEAVTRFISGKSEQEFNSDEVLRSAVERKVEVIGEAACGISDAFQDAHPEIAWRKIMATRHILAHHYDEVNISIVWRIATVYVPELVSLIAPLIPPTPAEAEPKP